MTTDPGMGHSQLEAIGATTLILRTRVGGGSRTLPARQQKDYTLLDVFSNAAVAKIVASDWGDYLQLAKVEWAVGDRQRALGVQAEGAVMITSLDRSAG